MCAFLVPYHHFLNLRRDGPQLPSPVHASHFPPSALCCRHLVRHSYNPVTVLPCFRLGRMLANWPAGVH